MKIAFIGLGIMGSRMAENLIKGGHEITVHNRTKEKAEQLLSDGALWAETPAGAVNGADVLITMLEKPDVVEKVALGENGFLDAMREGAIWIDSSTVNPSFSMKMAEKAKEKNIHFLDAPVSGSKVPAAKAELIFLVGGEPEILEEVQPLLDLMGKKTLHIGPSGKGAAMKIMINQMLGQSVLAFSESLSLGLAMGIDKKIAIDVLLSSPVSAPILTAFRSRIEDGNYEPNFPIQHLQKDLQLFTDTAYEHSKPAPLTNTAKEVYALAKNKNKEEVDFTAVFDFLNS